MARDITDPAAIARELTFPDRAALFQARANMHDDVPKYVLRYLQRGCLLDAEFQLTELGRAVAAELERTP